VFSNPFIELYHTTNEVANGKKNARYYLESNVG